MSKRANSVSCGRTTPSMLKGHAARCLLAGAAIAAPLFLASAGTALAQQAYYFPQANSAPVTVNYGALTPYAGPVAPGVPGGFQPYGYAPNARLTSAPKSVFTPYGAPAAAYPAPAYAAPYGYAAAPVNAPFVAPYANPAFAPGFPANRTGLPASTPTASGYPQSYLNVPGAKPVTLLAPGEATPKKTKKKKKKATAAPASTPTATEEGAAAQVAAAEAALETGPAPAAPVVPVVPEAPAVAAVAEPVAPPTPPAEPTEVPASVPSPAATAPAASIAAAPAAETATAETPAVEAPAVETPAVETPAADQVASAEAPAETAPDTSGNAVLPAGATRIVFEGGSDDLPQGATGDLDALAQKMLDNQNLKVQVLAYSAGTPDAESQARRKALARGLEVRKYLIGKGVRSNRIDVRALGTKSEGNPADRVDIVPTEG